MNLEKSKNFINIISINMLKKFLFGRKKIICYIPLLDDQKKRKDCSSPLSYYCIFGHDIFERKIMVSIKSINYLFVRQVILISWSFHSFYLCASVFIIYIDLNSNLLILHSAVNLLLNPSLNS